ncbi:unnamed protein product [Effrenium voratum]|nr:unnamed protein product [Effrenium voratum]
MVICGPNGRLINPVSARSVWFAQEMLLTPWGEQVKYEAFLAWLFKAKASLAPSGSFKVALFSSAPYDKAWFDKTNQDLAMGIEFRYFEEQLTLETTKLASGCDAVCTFVNDYAGAEVVEKLSQAGVRLIALRCAGFDRVDLEAAQKNGVTVARVPAYSPYAVGEHAVALLLSLNRHIARAYRNSMGNFKLAGLGQDLAGKRVGIIGTGLIGSIAARVLKKGFDCEVVAYDVFENPKIKNPEPEGLGIPYMDLDALLASCDFISLHAPLLPTTKHMINEERLKSMKKGIMIVNTSRGGLIDTNALIKGLRQGIIAGAALDVVEGEAPYFFRDHSGSCITDPNIALLLRMPNVILTPHLAFFTREPSKNETGRATFRELSARLGSQILAVRVRKNEVAWSTKEAPPEQRVLNVLGGNSVAQRSTYSSLGGSVLSLPFASNQTRVTWLPCFPFPWTFEARLSFARGPSR